ncbi:hypothetical protein LTR84_006232 [Exophiala bonariae]|uniref:Uncharacterized protein n=1 Tax=Exophiala bonariae TaxID=1690606 RepID=A0AAV9N337_9EURO|nr:hypothetical protein LTR84_006232 [Exophiala bonariae]
MEFRFPKISHEQSNPVSSLGRKNSSPWRSIFNRRKHSVDTTQALDMRPYLISVPLEQRPMLSFKERNDLPQGQQRTPSRASSRASWSPFGKKDRTEDDSVGLTAREVYHQRRVKNPKVAQSYPSRSRSLATHGMRPQISAPVYQPWDTWAETSDLVTLMETQSLVGPEDASEAVFTLTRHPDPEAMITVQYSPRTNSSGAAETLDDVHSNITDVQDLAELDADKRNPIFDRIHADGWNQIIPKQWVDDEFSDEEGKTSASQSVYSQDTKGSDIARQPSAHTSPRQGWQLGQSPKATSQSVETSKPRFVFEDDGDEPERTKKNSRWHQDQIWWQKQTDALELSSTPYHQNQECPSDRLPCYIETVSQIKQADESPASRPKGLRHSDGIQRENLTTRAGRLRTITSPAQLIQLPSPSPKSPTRKTVDEFYNLSDSELLTPLPLRPRRGISDVVQSHRIHDDEQHQRDPRQPGAEYPPVGSRNQFASTTATSDPLAQGEASSSSDRSWETIRFESEEDEGQKRKPYTDAESEPYGAVTSTVDRHDLCSSHGGTRLKPNPDSNESKLAREVDEILNLYLTGGDSTSHLSTWRKKPNEPWSTPDYAEELVATPPRYSDTHNPPTSIIKPPSLSFDSSTHVPYPTTNPSVQTTTPNRPARSSTEPLATYSHDYRATPRHGHARASKPSHHQYRHGYRGDTLATLTLRQHARFAGDHPQSPGSRRCNGYEKTSGSGSGSGGGSGSGSVRERRRTSNPGVTLPVTVIDEFGNTWI